MVGIIGKLLSFTRAVRGSAKVSDSKIDPGGGPNVTAEHFQPAGDDAHPLPSDYAYAGDTPQRGRFAAVGYVDPLNAAKAGPGEKRIYARDGGALLVVELWLKADGTLRGENAAGWFELRPSGEFVANGARLTTSGDVVTSDGVSLRNHFHEQPADSGGDAESPTATPTATE